MAERRMYQRLALLAVKRYLQDVYPSENRRVSSVMPVKNEGEPPPDVYANYTAEVDKEQITVQVYDTQGFVGVTGNAWKCYSYDNNNNLTELDPS